MKYGIEIDQSLLTLLHNAYWKVIDGFRLQGTWNARNSTKINHSELPLAAPINYESFFPALLQELQQAKDTHLPPVLAEVNKVRGFDSTTRVIALQNWIAARVQDIPNFISSEFLEKFLGKYPNEIAAMITAALEYQKVGDREHALNKINQALSSHRVDLYANRVAVSIFAWSNNVPQSNTDTWLKDRYCSNPFEHFEVSMNGDVHVCCPDWLPISIGNIFQDTGDEIWNSPIAHEIRSSIVDGSFRYCSRLSCSEIVNRKLLPAIHDGFNLATSIHLYPKRVILAYDNSCNLACPSCRNEIIMADMKRQAQFNSIFENTIVPIIHEANDVKISGSGDPFASHHFRAFLKRINRKEFPNLKVSLYTNGQLFTEKSWEELELSGKVSYVNISIDAARAETYKIVRYPGDFERLLKNLEFIKQLRQSGEIKSLRFYFVVQQINYREMPEFVLLTERYNVDSIYFDNIRHWVGSLEEYDKKFVGNPAHPEYREFLEVLKAPELHRPNVRLPISPFTV